MFEKESIISTLLLFRPIIGGRTDQNFVYPLLDSCHTIINLMKMIISYTGIMWKRSCQTLIRPSMALGRNESMKKELCLAGLKRRAAKPGEVYIFMCKCWGNTAPVTLWEIWDEMDEARENW